MYYLLVEAVGIQQASRIHRDWYDRFFSDICGVLDNHGFRLSDHESDLLLFRGDDSAGMEPEQIVRATMSTIDALETYNQDILDFVVLLDYHDTDRKGETFLQMERLLRYVREHGAAYVTHRVLPAIELHVQTAASGELCRIVSTQTEAETGIGAYAEFVRHQEITSELDRVIERSGGRDIWITTTSSATIVGSLSPWIENDTILIPCYTSSTFRTVLNRLIRVLQHRSASASSDEARIDSLLRVNRILRERFGTTSEQELSSPWFEGELQFAVSNEITGYTEGTETSGDPLIVFDSFHNLGVETQQRVLSAIGALVKNRATIVVVSRTEPEAVHLVPGTTWYHYQRPIESDRATMFWRALGEKDDSSIARSLRRGVPVRHRLAHRIIATIIPVLPAPIIDQLYPRLGISLAERSRIVNDLIRFGIAYDETDVVSNPGIAPFFDDLLDPNELSEFNTAVGEFLIEKLKGKELTISPGMWEILEPHIGDQFRNLVHHDLLHRIAAGGSFETYERYADSELLNGPTMLLSDASARMKLYLRDSKGPETCDKLFQTIQRYLPAGTFFPEIEADIHLGMGEYLLARRDYPGALAEAKRAIMLQQDDEWGFVPDRGIGMSHLLMARILFAQRRLSDAGRYLRFARDESDRLVDTGLIANSLESVRLFLVGNISRARATADELFEVLLQQGYTDWFVLLWFLQGRVEYELGDYSSAHSVFRAVAAFCRSCGMDEPSDTAMGWAIRSRFVSDGTPEDIASALDGIPDSPERALFRAETLARHGRYAEAIPLLEGCIAEEQTSNRWPRLGVCWDNGYASIEDLVIADRQGSSQLLRLARAYYAWALAHVERQDESVPVFYELTRGNGVSTIDPYSGLYNYLYSSVLPEKRSHDRDDRITILGKSVKLVQERTSQIDDYRDKLRFLKNNRWNQQLMYEARHHNLV